MQGFPGLQVERRLQYGRVVEPFCRRDALPFVVDDPDPAGRRPKAVDPVDTTGQQQRRRATRRIEPGKASGLDSAMAELDLGGNRPGPQPIEPLEVPGDELGQYAS